LWSLPLSFSWHRIGYERQSCFRAVDVVLHCGRTAQPDRPVNRPRARVTVAPRSFLDAGTEVLPGERKFTDYALPAGSYSMPLSVVQSTGGRVGWHQSPLPGPFDLPSRYNPYGW